MESQWNRIAAAALVLGIVLLAQPAGAAPSYECKKRLVKVRYAVKNLESGYAWRKLQKRCLDRESAAGKVICASATKRYRSINAGKVAAVRARRRWAAKACAPEDML